MERTIAFAREHGYVETFFGRRRYLPALTGGGFREMREAERMAINFPVQGTATGDIVKLAMIEVSKRVLSETNHIRLLLQIHDELLFEVKDSPKEIEQAKKEIRVIMESVWKGRVRLVVDVKSGTNWADAK